MTPPGKILLIRLSSLGDILHAVPALRSLRGAFPAAQIDWLVDERMRFLLGAFGGIDHVIGIDTRVLASRPADPRGWRAAARVVRRLRAERYDVAIDLQGLVKTAVLARLSGAPRRIGFPRAAVKESPAAWLYNEFPSAPLEEIHVARMNLALAAAAGGAAVALDAPLETSDAARAAVERLLEREQLSDFVVINPGGGWPTKLWQPEKYGELARRIGAELGLQTVVTTGPGEEDLYRRIAASCRAPAPRHLQVQFLELVPLCRRARLFVGGDTGPFHLACAVGTPAVGIFGPTSPVRNGPLSSEDEVVVHELACSFCYGRRCPTANECMDITVSEVFEAVVRRLDSSRRSGSASR